MRNEKVANFQLWNVNDLDYRLKPQKLAEIIALSEKVQKGTASSLYGKGRFSPKMEQGVHHFHRLIADFISKKD